MSAPGRRPAAWAGGLLAWTVFLGAALVVLHSVGGVVAPPPLADPGEWDGWLRARQPAAAAVAVARLVAIGLAWYLLAVTVAGAAARLLGTARLVRAVDALSVPLVRRLVSGAAGMSLAAGAFAGTGGVAVAGTGGVAVADDRAASPAPAAVVMRRLPDEPTITVTSPPTMRRLPDGPPPAGPAAATPATAAAGPPAGTPTVAAAAAEPEAAPAAERTWTVRPGDHFWRVAEEVLAQAWPRPPGDREVDAYWRALVAANRPALRDPDNPDLLFAGQVIAVPPPPAAP